MKIKTGLANFLTSIHSEPWMMNPVHKQALFDGVKAVVSPQAAADFKAFDELFSGDGREKELTVTPGGLALIHVSGAISRRCGFFEWLFGCFDLLDLEREFRMAQDAENVRGILLQLDSPGGRTTGVPEAAELIAGSRKPVVAFTDSIMASAAYYLAAGADRIVATGSATVGSIGTWISLLDMSQMYENEGLEMHVFQSGVFKGMGQAGTALTDEHKEFLQNQVDVGAEAFFQFVERHRSVNRVFMDGSYYDGAQAEEIGFVDQVGSFEDAVALLESLSD